MSRIRYAKTKDVNVLESVKRYQHPTNGARYKVVLNMNEHRWLVVDDASDLVAASGLRVDAHKMKIDARNALAALGVELLVESRQRRSSSAEN